MRAFSTISLGNHNDEISFPLTKGSSLNVRYPQSYKFKTQTQDSLKNIALNIEYILYSSHENITYDQAIMCKSKTKSKR